MIWNMIAKLLTRPAIANWIIERAMKRPYSPIIKDGETYMKRYWLFNPYPDTGASGADAPWWHFPISIRVHHIMLPDQDRHLHDHPWNARTVILAGWYVEMREGSDSEICRKAGDTAKLKFGEYHRIKSVSRFGVYTLFITGRYRGTWGFLVDGIKVQWRKYLNM